MVNVFRASCVPEGELVRFVGYSRVSSGRQAGELKVSLPIQKAGVSKLCDRPGWEFIRFYEDHCTGDDPDRPGLVEMVRDGKKALFDVIVCYKVDRLTRFSLMDHRIVELVQSYGIRVVSVTEGDDPYILPIYAAFGAKDKDGILTRTKMGKDGLARQGIVPGGNLPFGYRRGKDRKPEVDPETGPLVPELFELSADEGLTASVSGAVLEESGRKFSRRYEQLSTSQIHKIIQNDIYHTGLMHYGYSRDREHAKKCSLREPLDDCIPIPFPTLVSKELWERVQAIKAEAMLQSPRSMKRNYPLKGLLICDPCGKPYRVKSDQYRERSENGKRIREKTDTYVRRYYCYTCERPSILADDIEEKVWAAVKPVLCSPELLQSGASLLERGSDNELAKEIKETKSKLREVRKRLDRVKAMGWKGQLEEAELDKELKLLKSSVEYWAGKLQELEARLEAGNGRQELVQSILDWTGGDGNGLEELGPDDQKCIINLLLSAIRVDWQNQVYLTFAVPLDVTLCYLTVDELEVPCFTLAGEPRSVRRAYHHTVEIAAGVRALLKEAGITQGELARWVGVSQRTVNRWAAGKLPETGNLTRLIGVADELGLGLAFPFEGALEKVEASHRLLRTNNGILVQFTLDLGE